MDDKNTAANPGPVPPYEAHPNVSPMTTGVSNMGTQQHPQGSASPPPSNPTAAPTQYPHPPIGPPGGQQNYVQTPAGSPPPAAGVPHPAGSPPPMGSPPPAAGVPLGHAPSGEQPTYFQQASPMASPGQEKGDFYNQPAQQGYPQQQQGFPQQQMMGVAQQGSQYQTAMPLASLQRTPAPVDCPNCRQRAVTRTEYHSGNYTHVWALITFWLCCLCCIPYLIKETKDVEHKCGHCGMLLACYHASGHTEVLAHA